MSAGNQDTAIYADLPLQVGPYLLGIAFNITIVNLGGGCSDQDFILIEEEDCSVGLNEGAFTNLNIIQSNNAITIDNNEAEKLNFKLINMTGTLINSMEINPNLQNSFDTSLLPSGLYLMNISNQTSQKTIKLIVY